MFVEKQGGTVHISSEPGQGTTFYFKWRSGEAS
ncbi:ATP-binding protein [Olivibacter sp. XZL3]